MSESIFEKDDIPAQNYAVFKVFKGSDCSSLGEFAKYVVFIRKASNVCFGAM